jgi:predicted RNA-binding protein with PUA-like domain
VLKCVCELNKSPLKKLVKQASKEKMEMTRTRNKLSVSRATRESSGRTETWFLSSRDEENGKDVQLDLQGFKVVAL